MVGATIKNTVGAIGMKKIVGHQKKGAIKG